LIHLQKRTMREPPADVLAADRYWILPNRFAVQDEVSAWDVRGARFDLGPEILPFYVRRIQRNIRRRTARRRERRVVADGAYSEALRRNHTVLPGSPTSVPH
jgi:hypothetical protein